MGFGTPDGDYWMGLEHVHFMTSQNNYTLRTNMTGWTGKSYWAQYDVFSVATEQDNYALVAMGYKGCVLILLQLFLLITVIIDLLMSGFIQ